MDKKIFLELSHKRERTTEREDREQFNLLISNPLKNNSFGGYYCLKLLTFNIGGNIGAFLGSVDSEKAKAGQIFSNCIADYKNHITYDLSYSSLLNYPFTDTSNMIDGKKVRIYCDGTNCSSVRPSNSTTNGFDCNKIAQTIFCEDIVCGGIVGNTSITNTTAGNCTSYNFDSIVNRIKNTTPPDSKISKYTGTFVCSSDAACSDFECSASLNPFPTTVSSSTNSTISPSNNFPANNSSNDSDLPKIVIPVIGGSLIIATAAGYYCYKKGKNSAIIFMPGSDEQEAQEVRELPIIHQPERVIQGIIETQGREIPTKQSELERLVSKVKNKIGTNLQLSLETLLDTQAEITKGNNTYSIRQDQREAKEKLLSKLRLDEINNLCQLQSEVTQLEIQEGGESSYQTQIEQLLK
ncbi:46274_t:CDS:2 [Gigaspora margarita]|uniref:46274_t:CDS:1 n=1 Tax=Gigaspora margarita TaxID=4874 RepID=A0ABN7VXZ1_GIGMA|nr:46274_t:CDS:2 [Gigaspora margarita]